MSVTLDEEYLTWLHSQVSPISVKNPAYTYWHFLLQLYKKEFMWFVPYDENRIADARELREEFLDTVPVQLHDDSWQKLGVSVLEVLVALARRIAFLIGDRNLRDWFWTMLENANFPPISDKDYYEDPEVVNDVDHILDTLIWRNYEYNGDGGLFPLINPPEDQRKTELWRQMNNYINEYLERGG